MGTLMSGTELRMWRKAHHLTQVGLAERLGITWITVQRWEVGHQAPPPYLYLALEALEARLATTSHRLTR
jgi:DNA-binding transcriptional regulator YiaG